MSERDMVFGVKVELLEGRYPIFYGKFLDILKSYMDQEPRI